MATSWQRRTQLPDAAQQAPTRAEVEAEAKAREAQRQLEKGEQTEVNPEVAAAMQRGLGNAAVQGIVKAGSDTSTATTSAEAVQEEAKEEGEEEQEQEKEAGEIEHALPSFSTGGGGGGGGGGKPGSSPWAVGRFFGGDDDAAPDEPAPEQARWRPMPFLPDPDDEEEIDAVGADEGEEREDLPTAEADTALGSATWRAGPLSRGLRHPALLARPIVEPEMLADGVSAVWTRARAMLRFLAANAGSYRDELAGAARAGVATDGLAVVIAQELATLEAACCALGPRWDIVADVAVDGRARPRVEQAAAERVRAGVLSAPDLFATVTGEPISASPAHWVEEVHRAALAAVEQAARLEVLPAVDLWDPGVPRVADPELAAFDRMLGELMGATAPEPAEGTVSAENVSALFTSMNALLGALGAVQVEAAAAAVAAWPWVSGARLASQLVPLDDALKAGARRLVSAGRAIEARIGTEAIGEIREASAEASAVRGLAEFARRGCFIAIADLLELREEIPGDADALRRVCAFGAARAAGQAPEPLHADTPYAIALSAVADPRGREALLDAAPRLRSLDHGAALNLLKARWMELS